MEIIYDENKNSVNQTKHGLSLALKRLKVMKTKLIRKFSLPTDQEDIAINAGIATDPDTYEFTDEDFARLKPVKADEQTKERITVSLSPDVVNAFRATGADWQAHIDAALKEWLTQHPQPMR